MKINLCEDVEFGELCRLFLGAEGVSFWRFGDILSSRIFIEDLRAIQVSFILNKDGQTDVRPRWDDTNFSRVRPISGRIVEWLLRHSISRS
jgi:hypothetical protein